MLLAFAPGPGGTVAAGDRSPERIERLPQNGNAKLAIPQYAGFALDGKGNFWTADRSTGLMDEFPLAQRGAVKPLAAFAPEIDTPKGLQSARASTVADDGNGNVYCSCQDHDLALELYAISTYRMTGKHPVLASSFYGIVGNEDSQFPAQVLHVDAARRQIYIGYFKPSLVLAYPADAPSGLAPRPRLIGGPDTTLDANVASLATDAQGNLYVAIGSSISVFPPNAGGDRRPARIITDPADMQFFGYSFGSMLLVR